MPCTGRPLPSRTSPSHWNPGESARKPRSISASTRRPAHAAGTSPVKRNHVVPHGGPHRPPTANGAEVVERRPGLDVEGAALGVHERQHALGQLPGDPLLDQLAVVVHRRPS